MKQSKKYQLNKADLISIAKGLAITLGGAGLTYLSETIVNVDFGEYTPLIVTVFSLLINTVRKYVSGK